MPRYQRYRYDRLKRVIVTRPAKRESKKYLINESITITGNESNLIPLHPALAANQSILFKGCKLHVTIESTADLDGTLIPNLQGILMVILDDATASTCPITSFGTSAEATKDVCYFRNFYATPPSVQIPDAGADTNIHNRYECDIVLNSKRKIETGQKLFLATYISGDDAGQTTYLFVSGLTFYEVY